MASKIRPEGKWSQYHYVVQDGKCRLYVDGQLVHQRDVVSDGFPWLTLRHHHSNLGRLRDIRISGNPQIPSELQLDQESLAGWIPYYNFSVSSGSCVWKYVAGEIVAPRNSNRPPGSGAEDLLYYQRPLLDGDSISYDFYYRPGTTAVHPALGHVAFLFDPDGIELHPITDGYFDQTYSDRSERQAVPQQGSPTPGDVLQPNAWNRVELVTNQGMVQISLNGKRLLSQPIAKNSERHFGLFYFADRSNVRVKNVVLQGSWPTEIPALADQPLASPIVRDLESTRSQMQASFQHDFVTQGVPEKYFQYTGANTASHQLGERGATIEVSSPPDWKQAGLGVKVRMSGDFDVEAEFDSLNVEGDGNGRALLTVPLALPNKYELRASRNSFVNGKQTISAALQWRRETDSVQMNQFKTATWVPTSGTLRVARRGSTAHMLIKNSEGEQYRYVGSYQCPQVPTFQPRLTAVSQKSKTASVTWRNVKLRAQQMILLDSAAGERRLFLVDANGDNLVQITKTIGELGSHGSPCFSHDGKWIAFDTFKNSTRDSHLFIVRPDGTELTDLGMGSMPTFFPDGKRIAFSSPSEGMMTMRIDGSDRQVVSRSGWGAQISPDGKQLLYTDRDSNGYQNLILHHLDSGNRTALLAKEIAQQYTYFYWNAAWSRDGTQIGFRGRRRGSSDLDLAVVSRRGSAAGFKVLRRGPNFGNDLSWHPDGKRLLISRREAGFPANSLLVIKPDDPDFEQIFAPALSIHNLMCGIWSPNGKRVVLSMPVNTEFADVKDPQALLEQMDAERKERRNQFSSDFDREQINPSLLNIDSGVSLTRYNPDQKSLSVLRKQPGPALRVSPKTQIVGDFDFSVRFSGLSVDDGGEALLAVRVPFETDNKLYAMITRRITPAGNSFVELRCNETTAGQSAPLRAKSISTNSTSGQMRLSRRGSKLYFIFEDLELKRRSILGYYDVGSVATKKFGAQVTFSGVGSHVDLKSLRLSADELYLNDPKVREKRRTYVMQIDGTQRSLVCGDLPDFGGHGSPKFSPDGERIAFDTFNGGFRSSHVFVANVDGSDRNDLGQGSMPTFTPDGKRLVFTSNDGLMSMNIDGSDRELLHQSGRSAKISFDGERIAFYDYERIDDQSRPNLYVMNLRTKEKKPLLVGDSHGLFTEIQWNGAWSPDDREFVFRGKLKDSSDYGIFVVNTNGSDHGLELLRPSSDYTCDLGWHPSGTKIFVSKLDHQTGNHQMVFVPRQPGLPDEAIPGQLADESCYSSGVSRDGSRLVFTAHPRAKFVSR